MSIVKSYYKVLRVLPDPDYFYVKNEYNGNNTFKLYKTGTPNTTDLEYSKDKSTWTQFDLTKNLNTVTLASGEKLYMRSTTGFSKDSNNTLNINCSNIFSTGGILSTLIDWTRIDEINTIPDCCFYQLFRDINGNDSYLINADNLDLSRITIVGVDGLRGAFMKTKITNSPDLSSLKNIYGRGLGNLFVGCTSLVVSADLSGITQISGSMAFQYMYANCTLLNSVTTPNISSWDVNYFFDWLSNVSATGVVRKPSGLTITTGNSGVPSGWTTTDY